MSLSLLLRCRLIAVALAVGLSFGAAAANGASATGKGQLGVAVANPSQPWQGALIARVVPQGAAERAGLRPQDLIVEADSQAISSASDLTAYVATRRAGDRVRLTVMRWNGTSLGRVQALATLGPAPAAEGKVGAAVPEQHAPASPPPASAPAQGLTHVAWTTFTDPNENAFTIEVPRGWKVVGGIFRKIPLWPSTVVRALSPDRRTLIALGDPESVPYNTPVAARDYVRRFTESAMRGACSGLKIDQIDDLPEVERFASSHSLGTYNQWSAAHAAFSCNGDRQAGMAGGAIAVLQYMTTLRSGHAQVLAAFVTTRGQDDAADQLLNHMVSSIRANPQWEARQQQTAAGLAAGAMARMQGERRQFQQMEDAITNTAHFVGPDGQHYDLDARPRYQWLTPNGQTASSDTPTPPAPGDQLLERRPEQQY